MFKRSIGLRPLGPVPMNRAAATLVTDDQLLGKQHTLGAYSGYTASRTSVANFPDMPSQVVFVSATMMVSV